MNHLVVWPSTIPLSLANQSPNKGTPAYGSALNTWRSAWPLHDVKAVERHHFDPSGDKIIYKLFFAINRCIGFCDCAQLGI